MPILELLILILLILWLAGLFTGVTAGGLVWVLLVVALVLLIVRLAQGRSII